MHDGVDDMFDVWMVDVLDIQVFGASGIVEVAESEARIERSPDVDGDRTDADGDIAVTSDLFEYRSMGRVFRSPLGENDCIFAADSGHDGAYRTQFVGRMT